MVQLKGFTATRDRRLVWLISVAQQIAVAQIRAVEV